MGKQTIYAVMSGAFKQSTKSAKFSKCSEECAQLCSRTVINLWPALSRSKLN